MTRKRVITLVAIAIIPLLVGGIIAGLSIWYDSTFYVQSDDARVSATVTQVASPGTGQVVDLPYDVGDTVQRGEMIATIDLAPNLALGDSGSGTALRVPVRAPQTGVIIRRSVHVGERVASDAPIIATVNLSSVYVVADVDETKVPLLQVGEPATVYLRAFDRNFPGQVGGLTPATSDLLNVAAAAQVANGATPLVPIIIYFDTQNQPVYPGMSASVSIKIK